jgi:hypothetical protein
MRKTIFSYKAICIREGAIKRTIIRINLLSTKPTKRIRATAAIEGAVLRAVLEVILQGVF